jgi:hypothetical protein
MSDNGVDRIRVILRWIQILDSDQRQQRSHVGRRGRVPLPLEDHHRW